MRVGEPDQLRCFLQRDEILGACRVGQLAKCASEVWGESRPSLPLPLLHLDALRDAGCPVFGQPEVFGVGDENADWVFVGEGPGADEDALGDPFVGQAGKLLDSMLAAARLARGENVYICNVVKCRPPGNRNPEPDEIAACEPFLRAQLLALQPKVIVALGKFAAQTLLRDSTPITWLRGNWREYQGVKLMPTFHPAYLLRSPAEKRKAWEDLQQVMKLFGKQPGSRT